MFHFEKNFGLFIGKLTDNKYHKHYALQISVSLRADMTLSVKGKNEIMGKAFFINSKIEHKLISESNHLTILINPLCAIGHQIHLAYTSIPFSTLNDDLSEHLIELLNQFSCNEITFKNLCEATNNVLSKYQFSNELENHLDDNRIINALRFMEDHFEKVLSLEQVAAKCYLSPTRFIHLFKEKTNLPFRRYQLWNKVVKSLPNLMHSSITETAHAYGFSDSSHYTRTMIETFGITPKFLKPKQ